MRDGQGSTIVERGVDAGNIGVGAETQDMPGSKYRTTIFRLDNIHHNDPPSPPTLSLFLAPPYVYSTTPWSCLVALNLHLSNNITTGASRVNKATTHT